MTLSTLLTFFAFGFIVAMPIGPTALICLQRVASKNFWAGFVTGLGAVLSDSIYALTVGLAAIQVTDFVNANRTLMKVVGAVVLILFAVIILTGKAKDAKANQIGNSNFASFSTTFLYMLFNPVSAFIYIGFYPTILAQVQNLNVPVHVFFLALGGATWWLVLNGIFTFFKAKISTKILARINIAVASILILLAVVFSVS